MLAEEFTPTTPLPYPGSEGYLRGTGHKVRVLQRNHRPSPGGERTCLVKLFERVLCLNAAGGRTGEYRWLPVGDAAGNKTVEERDLYAERDEALHCGRKPRRQRRKAR